MKMFQNLSIAWQKFRGSTVSVPSLDGALKPNTALDKASAILELQSPDNLVAAHDGTYFSTGADIHILNDATGSSKVVFTFESTVSCLAAIPNGGLAVGLDDGSIHFNGGRFDGLIISSVNGKSIKCPTAIICPDEKTMLLCVGSSKNSPDNWRLDLMTQKSCGSVWQVDLKSGKAKLHASKLAYPYGIMLTKEGQIIVSESWRHRIITLQQDGRFQVLLDHLPGYPARIIPASGFNGAWLCIFAPRRAIIEFMIRNKKICNDMIQEVEEQYWLAPSLSTGTDFKEPLLGGEVKQLGILKPWAPTRSYGLLVQLNENFQPVKSFHSRGDGNRHGITSCIDTKGKLIIASKGGHAIVSLNHSALECNP